MKMHKVLFINMLYNTAFIDESNTVNRNENEVIQSKTCK